MSEEFEALSSATSRRPPDGEDILEPEQSQQQLSQVSGTVIDLSKKKTKNRQKQRNMTLNTIEKAVHRTSSAKTQLVEGEYEIEQIRMIKVLNKNDLRFLVKWQGWPEEDNTWEPFANIRTCLFHLRSFYREGLTNKRLVKQPAWKMLTGCLLLEGLIDTKTGQFVLSESEASSDEDDDDSLSISGDSSSSHDSEIPINKKRKRDRSGRSSSTKSKKNGKDKHDQEHNNKHKSREGSDMKTAENITTDTGMEGSNIEQNKGSSSSLNNKSNKRKKNSSNSRNRSNNSSSKQKRHGANTQSSNANHDQGHADQTDQSSKQKDDFNGQQSISRKRLKMSLPQSQQEATGPQFFRSTKEYLEAIQQKELQPFSYRDTHPSLGQTINEYMKVKQEDFAKKNPDFISELAKMKENKQQNSNQLIEESENKQKELETELQDPLIQQEELKNDQGEGNVPSAEDIDKNIIITQDHINDPDHNISQLPTTQSMASSITSNVSVPSAEDNMEWTKMNEIMLGYPCSEIIRSHWGRIEQDEPSAIIQMDCHPWKEGSLIYLVSWDPRKKKRQLLPSWVDASSFKLTFPQIVIDFYQSFIKLQNSTK